MSSCMASRKVVGYKTPTGRKYLHKSGLVTKQQKKNFQTYRPEGHKRN